VSGLTINLGDDFDDADNVDISASTDGMSIINYATQSIGLSLVSFGTLATLPLLAIRDEPRDRFREGGEN